MSKLEDLSHRLDDLEVDYRLLLVGALQECAAGRWGLFGQNDHTGFVTRSPELDVLRDLATSINQLRDRLTLPAFALHEEFESARGRVGPNALGEAKLAQLWLQRLAEA